MNIAREARMKAKTPTKKQVHVSLSQGVPLPFYF
jgi:hypothetical protein